MSKAQDTLQGMKKSLREWLNYRTILTMGARGQLPGGDRVKALTFINEGLPEEAKLAQKLRELLIEADYQGHLPDDAESLARIVLDLSTEQKAAQGIGIWPLLIVTAGIVLMLTVRSIADYATEKRRIQCVEAGYCTDMGKWWKYGLIAVGGYLVLTKTEVGPWLKSAWNKTSDIAVKAWPHAKAGYRQLNKRG